MSLAEKLAPTPQKKLLALDGGGIRGMITVEVLLEIEKQLQSALGRGDDFVLADYFDYVAGTSTGAIIATCISWGMRVTQIREFYEKNGEEMFDSASIFQRFRYKYEDDRLARKLREEFGADTRLGTEKLRTLLLVVMRNATTDSPWPLSNNPGAKYNLRTRDDCNLEIPLWQIVRASTAAPTYFPPEVVTVGKRRFVFVDGGVTPYNNPAFLLFLMSTVGPYELNWPTGAERMLLVSVGTGASAAANADLRPSELNLLYNASSIPSALMYAAANEQDLLCRVFGDCKAGAEIDRELGDLTTHTGSLRPKLFTYMRYNADLSREGLAALGLPDVEPAHVQQLDSVEHLADLRRVGEAVARTQVRREHFARFLPQ